MNTKYSDVFELVLALMKSFEIDDVYAANGDDGITKFFIPYIKIASGELEISGSDINLSDRNDELFEFNERLSDGKQLVVAKIIFAGYLSKETHDILQMRLHLQDGDFKTYAEKNNLDGKLNALYTLKEEIDYNIKKIGYNEYKW